MMKPLIIPVENQLREFESKLLFACVAAERGHPVIIGARENVHREIATLPRGVYLAKSIAASSLRMFRIMRDLGFEIAAWVENALVHHPAEEYFRTQISTAALRETSRLLAWGDEDADLFRRCPAYHGAPIHVTGNPRIDLLRPEIRPCFDEEMADIRRRFGDFLLVNTNFGRLNHFVAKRSTLKRLADSANGAANSEFLSRVAAHRDALFSHFRVLVPTLAKAFPHETIVVRPHPVENPEVWRAIAEQHDNVYVVLEGNVIPWLRAARLLIHNRCTTAIEAFVLRIPSVAYHPVDSDPFDSNLPNDLSHRVSSFDELYERLRAGLDVCDAPEQWRLLRRQLASLDGPLASERIADVLKQDGPADNTWERPNAAHRLASRLHATLRARVRAAYDRLPGGRGRYRYHRHRFPALREAKVLDRIRCFQRQLGHSRELRMEQLSEHVFKLVK